MSNKIKKSKWVVLLFLAFFIFLAFLSYSPNVKEGDAVREEYALWKIPNTHIYLEVSETSRELQKGLSDRSYLEKNNGMLFVFNGAARHGIWMKDMLFPIDIIWLDENFKIVDIKKDAQPNSYPEVFRPRKESRYVIEVNSGIVDEFNLEINQETEVTF